MLLLCDILHYKTSTQKSRKWKFSILVACQPPLSQWCYLEEHLFEISQASSLSMKLVGEAFQEQANRHLITGWESGIICSSSVKILIWVEGSDPSSVPACSSTLDVKVWIWNTLVNFFFCTRRRIISGEGRWWRCVFARMCTFVCVCADVTKP